MPNLAWHYWPRMNNTKRKREKGRERKKKRVFLVLLSGTNDLPTPTHIVLWSLLSLVFSFFLRITVLLNGCSCVFFAPCHGLVEQARQKQSKAKHVSVSQSAALHSLIASIGVLWQFEREGIACYVWTLRLTGQQKGRTNTE